MTDHLQVRFINSISQINKTIWSELINTDYPFIQYDFLSALENSGSTTADSGWLPNHLIIENQVKIIAIMPLYIKSHSYGEYIFDFQWANAYHQSGFEYYPKLVTAIPFTPCTGRRIYHDDPQNSQTIADLIVQAISEFSVINNISSWHCLFAKEFESEQIKQANTILRLSHQYHWFNHDYVNFDNFLASCKNKQRKNIRQERKQVLSQGIIIKQLSGNKITEEIWQQFYYFYQLTNAQKSGHSGYLNQAFFSLISNQLTQSIMMSVAYLNGRIVATALFFKDSKTLYGRYWGCIEQYKFLHFELCYYQGIDYCIKNKLLKFDAGAQGEHKISRGFVPIETYSNHWIADQTFSGLISNFVEAEKQLVKQNIKALKKKLPFK